MNAGKISVISDALIIVARIALKPLYSCNACAFGNQFGLGTRCKADGDNIKSCASIDRDSNRGYYHAYTPVELIYGVDVTLRLKPKKMWRRDLPIEIDPAITYEATLYHDRVVVYRQGTRNESVLVDISEVIPMSLMEDIGE